MMCFKISTAVQSITTVISGKKKQCVGHAACMGRRELHIPFWFRKLKEIEDPTDLGVDGTRTLKFILNTTGRSGLGLVCL